MKPLQNVISNLVMAFVTFICVSYNLNKIKTKTINVFLQFSAVVSRFVESRRLVRKLLRQFSDIKMQDKRPPLCEVYTFMLNCTYTVVQL